MSTTGAEIGNRIRQLRESLGLTKVALAKRAGIDRTQLIKIERGDVESPRRVSLESIARVLNCDISDLIDSTSSWQRQVTPYETNDSYRRIIDEIELLSVEDRKQVVTFLEWMTSRMPKKPAESDNVLEFIPARSTLEVIEEKFQFPVSPEDFKVKDFDYPRDWHYWKSDNQNQHQLAAGAVGVLNESAGLDESHILNPKGGGDVREIFDRLQKVVRIYGDSMESRYYNNDLVRVDTRMRNPQNGDIVAVYSEDLGGSLVGILKREDQRITLLKKNPTYRPVELPETGWFLLGVVVELVSRREQREKI